MTSTCPEPPAVTDLGAARETLLFVDDELFMRFLARSVLEKQGYRVLLATDGREALNIAAEYQGPPIALVITDIIMPVMGGDVLADWLQATNPELKILFTSGYTNDLLSADAHLSEGTEFLGKPYEAWALVAKVRAMLAREQ